MPALKDPFADIKKKFGENDLRTMWKTMKTSALNRVQQDYGSKARANLDGQFNKGLGPLLDKWSDEASQLPKIERTRLEDTYDSITRTVTSYRQGIKKTSIAGTPAAMVLDGTLDHLQQELDRQVDWYKGVGLW
jgi:hypothetical protein